MAYSLYKSEITYMCPHLIKKKSQHILSKDMYLFDSRFSRPSLTSHNESDNV